MLNLLLTAAMSDEMGSAVATQFQDWTDGESFEEQNKHAMSMVWDWMFERVESMEVTLSECAYEEYLEWLNQLEDLLK